MRASGTVRGLALGCALVAAGCVRHGTEPVHHGSTVTASSPASSAARIDEPDCDDAPAAASPAEEGAEGEHPMLDDGFEAPPPASPSGAAAPAPFAELTDAEIEGRLRTDIGALGPMSIGPSHAGVLVAGVRMPEGSSWELVSPGLAWGTKETVDSLGHAIDAVAARFPGTPKAFIANISARNGGHLPPHISHQSGNDVDLSYYLVEGHHRSFATATAANLDRARTWHLMRTLIAETDVDLILVDRELQRILKAYAREIGEDAAWLDQVFQAGGKSSRPTIFHAKGHMNHLHVRFYSPAARELGRRAYGFLLARRLVAPPTRFISHTVKSGETLSHLALRYKVTADAIKKANALTGDLLRVDRPYKIPQSGGVAMPARLVVPPRRVPPTPSASASASAVARTVTPCRR